MVVKFNSQINLEITVNGETFKIKHGEFETDNEALQQLLMSGVYRAITYDKDAYIRAMQNQLKEQNSSKKASK
jgi:hypothetical protein